MFLRILTAWNSMDMNESLKHSPETTKKIVNKLYKNCLVEKIKNNIFKRSLCFGFSIIIR